MVRLRAGACRDQVISKSWLTSGSWWLVKPPGDHFTIPECKIGMISSAVGIIPALQVLGLWHRRYHSGEGQMETPWKGAPSFLAKNVNKNTISWRGWKKLISP